MKRLYNLYYVLTDVVARMLIDIDPLGVEQRSR